MAHCLSYSSEHKAEISNLCHSQPKQSLLAVFFISLINVLAFYSLNVFSNICEVLNVLEPFLVFCFIDTQFKMKSLDGTFDE